MTSYASDDEYWAAMSEGGLLRYGVVRSGCGVHFGFCAFIFHKKYLTELYIYIYIMNIKLLYSLKNHFERDGTYEKG